MKTNTAVKINTKSCLQIKGFQESLINWNGKCCAMILLHGCNFSCPFCHNSVLVQANSDLPDISEEKILYILKEKRNWYDGVVISGGEPCLYHELYDLVKKIKALGYPIKLDTNGYKPNVLETLIKQKLIDFVAMDVKAPLNDKYKQLCGTNLDISRIKKSIEILRTSGIDYEFRTTFVPNLLEKTDLVAIATYLKGSKCFYIQQFNPEETLDKTTGKLTPYSLSYINDVIQECKKFVPNSRLRD